MLQNIINNSNLSIEPVSVEKKHLIYRNGQHASGFFYLQSGLVGLYQVSETGKESLLRLYGPGSFFGYRSLFTQQKYPSTSRAMLNCELIKINVSCFKILDKAAPELAEFLMRGVCAELGDAEKRIIQYNANSAKKRILDSIYHLFAYYPHYAWTYREIGEFSGTDTTTVIRYCKQLKKQGLLDEHSRKPVPKNLKLMAEFRQSMVLESSRHL